MTELSVAVLIEQVLTRNPSLAQMAAAWEAASARYPQITSLDDPMFGGTAAPASIGSHDVEFGYRVEVSQKYPWPGKRALRGANALAEANAARLDLDDMRLQLVETTQDAFYEYYLVGRALAVNEEAIRLLRDFRSNAQNRFTTGQVTQQDVLQADVEIGRQQERQLTLERMRHVALARLNTLMHLPTDTPLPPPPEQLRPAESPPEPRQLEEAALARRPDLRALAERINAERASLELAHKEYCPDVEVMAAYDTIMGNGPTRDLAAQVAIRINLPVRLAKRAAAVAEAQARLAQRSAELARQVDRVSFEVRQAYEQVRESYRALRLYDETILPAARENVKAAQTAYATGRVPFLSLIEAQRNLVGLRDRYFEATADYYRRRATLERVTGTTPIPELAPHQP